jgi:hypothetical protein
MTTVAGIARFERLFRGAAGLDVDKADLRRHAEFVDRKIRDLLLRAEANAKASGRDVMEPHDVPITKGLQERIHDFRALDAQLDLKSILDEQVARPPLDLAYGETLEASLPEIAGGLSVALAKAFKVLDPDLKNPQSSHWDRAFALFDLLV